MGNTSHIAFHPTACTAPRRDRGHLNWTDRSMRSPDVHHD